jgi:hypothetical protein
MPGAHHRFVAAFDVKASITEELGGPAEISPDAATAIGNEIRCERAVIETLDNKPRKWLAPGSSTHQANHWHFSKRTAVIVDRAHEAIANAIEKRKEKKRKEKKRKK